MTEPREDRAVDEVRELRLRVAAECGRDPARLIERYLKLQEQYADRLTGPPPTAGRADPDAA